MRSLLSLMMNNRVKKHSVNCIACSRCQCPCCLKKKSFFHYDNDHCCRLILIRHGLSTDEQNKRYSGWNDCDLSEDGHQQMKQTGQQLRQKHFSVDLCFTSLLKRAIQSLFIIQDEMDLLWLPVCNNWRLNDRMLGHLTGFHRDRAASLFGENQLKQWLIPAESAPPPLDSPSNLKYKTTQSLIPPTETPMDLRRRLKSFLFDELLTKIYEGQNLLIVSHEETIKELIRLLKDYSIDKYSQYTIPIGIPIIFEFKWNEKKLANGYYLQSSTTNENIDERFPLGFNLN